MWNKAEAKFVATVFLANCQQIFFMFGVYTGPVGGQDGTPKKKTVKKSLVSESTVPPGPTLRGKEEQGNSDLDHPGKFQTLEGCGGMRSLSASLLPGSFLSN